MKYRTVILLTLLAALWLAPGSIAASAEAEQAAEALHALDLFRGTSLNEDGSPVYSLDAVPSRNQAVMMLVRLLGAEEEAQSRQWDIPFTDVVPDTQSYYAIGYAYAHGLTKGTTATTYSGVQPVTRNQYLLFLLRALRYDSDTNPMYPVDAAVLAEKLGIIWDAEAADPFTRGGVALYSLRALDTYMKYVTSDETGGGGGVATLREYLGLGWSPALIRTASLSRDDSPVKYASSDEWIAAQKNPSEIREILPVDGGFAAYRASVGAMGGGEYTLRSLFVYQNGGMIYLPLPDREETPSPMFHRDAEQAAPVNLRYDAERNILSYEVTIEDISDLRWYTNATLPVIRRAGTYRCDCDLSKLAAVYTELLEKRPNAAAPLRMGRTETLETKKFESVEAARAWRFGEGMGTLQVEREISVPAGGETIGGTVLYWSFGGIPHGPAPRLGYVQEDGTLYRLPLPRTGFMGELGAPEDLACDGTAVTWKVSVSPEMSRHPAGGAVTYFYRYTPGSDTVYVVQQLEIPAA